MNKTLIALAATTALAGSAFAATLPTVKDIDVTVDITAVANEKAAAYWQNLEADLENAILARIVDQTDPEKGASILIDISEVELANAFTDTMGLEDSILKGLVHQSHATDNSRFNSYELTVTYDMVAPALGEGFNPALDEASAHMAYVKLVETFADKVVTDLK